MWRYRQLGGLQAGQLLILWHEENLPKVYLQLEQFSVFYLPLQLQANLKCVNNIPEQPVSEFLLQRRLSILGKCFDKGYRVEESSSGWAVSGHPGLREGGAPGVMAEGAKECNRGEQR